MSTTPGASVSEVARGLLFSRQEGRRIGAFEYRYGLVQATVSDEAQALLEQPGLLARHAGDPDTELRYLLEASSLIHERRHYLDTFGTASGIALFAARMKGVKLFIHAAKVLMHEARDWQLPLSAWVREDDCPAAVRRLKRHARAENIGVDIFIGNAGRVVAPGHQPHWWAEIPLEGMDTRLPAFPLSMATGRSEAAIAAGEFGQKTVYFPLGYETLVEGTAHSLARSLVQSWFPDAKTDVLVKYGSPLRLRREQEAAHDALLGEHLTPYNVTDLLVTKMLQEHGISTFPRALILKLSDIALSSGEFKLTEEDGRARLEVVNPAAILRAVLEQATPDELRDNRLAYPEQVSAFYAGLLARLKQGGDWDQVRNRTHDEAAVYVWESFLAHHVTIPLLERRLATGHANFCEEVESVEQVFEPALPLVEVLNDHLHFRNIPPEVQTAWWLQMMAGEIAHQVMQDATMLLCPRAHKLLPGMDSVDLATGERSCDDHKCRGCGSWQAGGYNVLPDCLFTRTLQTYGFVPIHRAPVAARAPETAGTPGS